MGPWPPSCHPSAANFYSKLEPPPSPLAFPMTRKGSSQRRGETERMENTRPTTRKSSSWTSSPIPASRQHKPSSRQLHIRTLPPINDERASRTGGWPPTPRQRAAAACRSSHAAAPPTGCHPAWRRRIRPRRPDPSVEGLINVLICILLQVCNARWCCFRSSRHT